MSNAVSIASATSSSANSSRIKSKEVDFTEQLAKSKAPPKRRRNRMDEREAEVKVSDQGSDLADIDEVEESLNEVSDSSLSQPSPRRLRSKETACDQGKKKTPVVNVGTGLQRIMTRSQRRVSDSTRTLLERSAWELSGQMQKKDSLEEEANALERREDEGSQEGESDEEGEETGEENEDGKEDGDRAKNDVEEMDVVEDDEDDEEEEEINSTILQVEDEADELVSSASTTSLMSQSRRTPLRKRLRPRTRNGSLNLDDSNVEDVGEEDGGELTCSEEREVVDEIRVDREESMDVDEIIAAKPLDEYVEIETGEEDIGEEDSETGDDEEVGGDTDSEIDIDVDVETDKVMEEEGVYAFGASSFAYELISV